MHLQLGLTFPRDFLHCISRQWGLPFANHDVGTFEVFLIRGGVFERSLPDTH